MSEQLELLKCQASRSSAEVKLGVLVQSIAAAMRVHTHLCFGRRKRTRSQLRGLCGFQASERSQEFAECLSALKTRGGLCYIASLIAFCWYAFAMKVPAG
uniref:Uncharacterized protein n=1 Tax=Plectus sambesii TaxID=2011161 RepID=A0A914XGL2_9BILA